MKTYQKMKDSGEEEIGYIPEHWEIMKLKFFTTCLDGKRIPLNGEERSKKLGDIPYYGASGIVDYVSDYIFDEKLVCLSEDGENLRSRQVPISFIISGKSWVNNHVHVLRVTKSDPEYLVYYLDSMDIIPFLEGATRSKLNQEAMNNISIPKTNMKEQKQIVNYLDKKTSKIDSEISKNQKLITLLENKRQITINYVVTKGLDPKSPMKDSGIEWIGKIPQHWKHGRLGYFTELISGFAFESEKFYDGEDGIRLVRGDNVTEGKIRWGEKTRKWINVTPDLQTFTLKENDVLIGMDGSKVGKNYAIVTYDDLPSLLVQRVARLRARKELDQNFIFYLIGNYSFSQYINSVKTNVAIPHMSPNDIQNYLIPIPPKEDQIQITKFIEIETSKIDSLISNIKSQIKKLQKLRQSLISSAVTGKIDVRQEIVV